jgi:hypothetical protein
MSVSIPPAALAPALANPPFIPIPGILNLRDPGCSNPSYLRPGLLYRSGALAAPLPPRSVALLKDTLHIELVLDLRSESEVLRAPDPEMEGVRNVWVRSEREATALDLGAFVKSGAREGYVGMYGEVLENYRESFGEALRWVGERGHGGGAMLFHCSGEWSGFFVFERRYWS